jgi:hypothetical protein
VSVSDTLQGAKHLSEILAILHQTVALAQLADDLLDPVTVTLHRGSSSCPGMLGRRTTTTGGSPSGDRVPKIDLAEVRRKPGSSSCALPAGAMSERANGLVVGTQRDGEDVTYVDERLHPRVRVHARGLPVSVR